MITFWSLFFLVVFLLVALVIFVFVIIDGIHYNENARIKVIPNLLEDKKEGDK